MSDKNYLSMIVFVGILLILSVVYLAETTDLFADKVDNIEQEVIIPEFEAIPDQAINCNACHVNPEDRGKHINGSEYCGACHGFDIHELHMQRLLDTSGDFTCSICHTDDPIIPQKLPDRSSICDSCHGYPDPSEPSYGNIITIHMTRGYTCDICHIQDIQTIHKIT